MNSVSVAAHATGLVLCLSGILGKGTLRTYPPSRVPTVPNLPLVHNSGLDFGADFIVKDLENNIVPTVGKVAHDGVVGSQSVFIGPVHIRGAEDCVDAAVEGDGNVLVAAASPDGDSTSAVGVELGKQEVHDVELVSGGQCSGFVTGIFWSVSGLCIRRSKWCKEV